MTLIVAAAHLFILFAAMALTFTGVLSGVCRLCLINASTNLSRCRFALRVFGILFDLLFFLYFGVSFARVLLA